MAQQDQPSYELHEDGAHPLWAEGIELAEQLPGIIHTSPVNWTKAREIAARLVAVADKAIAEGPTEGLT